jgi:hypothetical protein
MKFFMALVLFSATSVALGAQDYVQFSHSISTTASQEQIWKIWTDVPNWHTWDTGLKSASLKDEFEEGVKGKLIPDEGPKSSFKISELEEGRSYTLKTRIPFGALIVRRFMEVKDDQTIFTHEVEFTGWLKKAFAKRFGKRYKAMLPEVMENIKRMAEEE